jgi:phenylacetate-CoA ligase
MATPTQARPAADYAWLHDQVDHAIAHIPFYRDHLAAAAAAAADPSRLAGLPTFDKRATAGYGQFPISAGGPTGAYRVVATSGTTGDRLFIAFDRTDWDRVGDWLEQVGYRVGFAGTDVLLNTHCYGLWVGGPILDLLTHRAGGCVVPLGPTSPAGVLHMLTGGVGTAISATPSYLRRLIEAAETAGVDLRRTGLRFGFIGAEAAEPALRHKLLSRLPDGFRWVELYGLTETFGPSVAFAPDPEVPELELNTGDFQVEVLSLDADTPAEPRAVGELALTSRKPSRSPLIRYRTRDLVRVTDGTADAPTRISQILGRADDALKIGGVLMYPTAVADIITGMLPPAAEWRGVVRRRGLDDELVLQAEASAELCEAVEVAFQERVGMDVTVVPTDGAALARSREKTRRIVIEVVPDDAPPGPSRRAACG